MPETAWTREDGDGDGQVGDLRAHAGAGRHCSSPRPAAWSPSSAISRRASTSPTCWRARSGGVSRSRCGRAPAPAPRTRRGRSTATRRPKEAGLDALLAYDALRRGSLIEGFFAEAARRASIPSRHGARRAACSAPSVSSAPSRTAPAAPRSCSRARRHRSCRSRSRSGVTIRDATLEVRYRVRPAAGQAAHRTLGGPVESGSHGRERARPIFRPRRASHARELGTRGDRTRR